MKKIAEKFKCAHIAVIGRPNAGKSTLLNALLENNLCAVSDRPQTTRSNSKGVYQNIHAETDEWDGQLVFVDTPGIDFKKGLLERSFHQSVADSLMDVDIVYWVADARKFLQDLNDIEMEREGPDKVAGWLAETMRSLNKKCFLILSKADLVKKENLLPLIEKTKEILPEFSEIIPVSSVLSKDDKRSNLETLIQLSLERAESTAPAHPIDYWTNVNARELVRSFIMEAVFNQLKKEVPYLTECSIFQFKEPERSSLKPEVDAVLWVSRKNLKRILVGANGSRIKEIGMTARKRYKEVTGQEIILRTHVKVVERWEQRSTSIEELGYVLG